MEKTVQSNEAILHTPTFQRNASAENIGEAEVYETHYEENVVLNNFNVMPGQSLLLVVTYFVYTWGGLCRYCLLYTSPSPRDKRQSRMPSSA